MKTIRQGIEPRLRLQPALDAATDQPQTERTLEDVGQAEARGDEQRGRNAEPSPHS